MTSLIQRPDVFSIAGRIAAAAFATAALLCAQAFAQERTVLSGRDIVHPVIGWNGMVSSQEAVATRIGVDILRRGGNAVDAAVGVAFALAVTLPRAGNLGGGGFMVIHLEEDGETVALDYRERAPLAADRDMFLKADGEVDRSRATGSPLSVGVPGTVAGMALALERWGTMSLGDVVSPAIDLAAEGVTVTEDLALSLEFQRARFADGGGAGIFYRGDENYRTGDVLIQEDLAWSLEQIRRGGADAFYRGEIGERLVAWMAGNGGLITAEDLEDYSPVIRTPVTGNYRGYDIASMPPPSSGGTHIVQILNILEQFPIQFLGHNTDGTIHLVAETTRLAYADRSQHLGDPAYWDVPVAGLTSEAYADELRSLVNRNRATPSSGIGPGDPGSYESTETTHFSVMDGAGNVVSNTYTLNFSYGSGLVAEGTGIILNNQMDNLSARAGEPNAYGLLGGEANAIQPGKRPLSSMSPTILFRDSEPWLATGSPGGSTIITTVLQIIMNVVDHDMNIAEATNAARFQHQWYPDEIRMEPGISADTIRLLEDRGHIVRIGGVMGSTQSIMRTDGVFLGASDPRRPTALTLGY